MKVFLKEVIYTLSRRQIELYNSSQLKTFARKCAHLQTTSAVQSSRPQKTSDQIEQVMASSYLRRVRSEPERPL